MSATPIDDYGARSQQFLIDLENPEPGDVPIPTLRELGDESLQRLFLQAVRLDALHGTAPFVSVQRTAVIPVAYQLVPLVMALRQQPCRMLLADSTGLGKTIEAGLVASELVARARAKSVLIVTPANLREQWKEQMRELFYMDFEVISSETRKRMERSMPPGADPWHYFDRLIVSIDYAKDIRIRPEILKRRWDVVIVDEAHNAAMPHGLSRRKADMERWNTVQRISENCDHLLLLTATPHNGFTDSYSSLLKMLSPELVTGEGMEMRPNREKAVLHVCQRTRKDVQRWFEESGQQFPFPERESSDKTEVPATLHKDYAKCLSKLDDILNYLDARIKHTQAAEWLRLHLHRRALSSPEALRLSLENRIRKLRDSVGRQEGEDALQAANAEETLFNSLQDKGAGDAETEDERDRMADAAIYTVEQRVQIEQFDGLLKDLRAVKASKDRKLAKLRDEVIPALLAKADEDTPARIIVFTRFKDTLNYLQKELEKGDYEVIPMHGDLSEAKRDEEFNRFASSERAVLLATDVISEGLNLQRASAMIVHYDVPWNPNRLEQRNGRVDRFGQRSPVVYVRTLYCRDTTDEDVMRHLVRKLENMRRDLGFAPPFFATEETVLRVLTKSRKRRQEGDLFSLQSGLFDEESLFNEDAIQRMKSEGFYGQTEVRVGDVAERLRAMHDRFGSPERIKGFVKDGLRHFGCSVEENQGTLAIQVNNPRLRIHGLDSKIDKAVLDPEERAYHPDAKLIDVGHPLVRRLNAVIREESLLQTKEGARTAAYAAKGLRGTHLVAHGLLRATAATEPPTLLEEVVVYGVRIGLGGVEPLADEEAHRIANLDPSKGVDRDQALADVQKFSAHASMEEARERAVQTTVDALRTYRSQMREELRSGSEPAWLKGFDEIELIGFDLYCLTLVRPEGL